MVTADVTKTDGVEETGSRLILVQKTEMRGGEWAFQDRSVIRGKDWAPLTRDGQMKRSAEDSNSYDERVRYQYSASSRFI
jgi:hypothetical protein